MIPWHYANPPVSVDPHRASSSRPKNAVKTRKGLLRPENRSRQPRIAFWEPAHLSSRLRVATGVPRPCFFRAGERRSPPLAAVENMRKGPQVLYFEPAQAGPLYILVQASTAHVTVSSPDRRSFAIWVGLTTHRMTHLELSILFCDATPGT